MKIEYFEPSGKQGGCEGYEVDFDKKMLYPSHGRPEKFSLDNAEDIQWVIEGNIQETKDEIKRINEKLALTKEKRVPIDGGYKLLVPPTERTKEILNAKLKANKDMLAKLKSLNVMELIK